MTKEIGHYKSYEGLEFMEFTSIHCPSFVGASYLDANMHHFCSCKRIVSLQSIIQISHSSCVWSKIWA